ncbi:unnamed protein product [Mesocestoides corti]|uniref:alpha-L-fucosidase n=1 Tax=Mesocestoides corti TaxID=53468 RepID=A0A0R3U3N4_MESCO|nr:unnamed protein product [Mesocestoides corti]
MQKWLLVMGLVAFPLGDTTSSRVTYAPNWESLDKRPLPEWYDNAKVGIFIHWGVFSVPSYVNEWFWWIWKGPLPDPRVWLYMKKYYQDGFAYPDFASQFRNEFFDPAHWARVLNASGAGYVVVTAKHHEGYCNWPSSTSWNWNSVEVGPNIDLIGELAKVIRANTTLRGQLYFYVASHVFIQDFVNTKTMPELYDLVNKYKPSIVWSDGADQATSDYWKAKEFLAWLYNESPVRDEVVVNDRWGLDAACAHGDFLNCNDGFRPDKVVPRKWECCTTIDKHSWGYRRDANLADHISVQTLIETLVDVVSLGGNLLLNIGPTAWGTIDPIFEERLLSMGLWLRINGEAIYNTDVWTAQRDPLRKKLWYTRRKSDTSTVYALFADWPLGTNKTLTLPAVKAFPGSIFTLLDGSTGTRLTFTIDGTQGAPNLELPAEQPPNSFAVWTVRMQNVTANSN